MYLKSSVLILSVAVLILSSQIAAVADVQSVSPLSTTDCQIHETLLGDLVADAVKSASGAQAAMIPAGSLREATIPKGPVSPSDVINCLQYPSDAVMIIELTGEQFDNALERSVSVYPQRNLGFLQVSGVTFTFDQSAPKGSRVSSVMIGGQKLVKDNKYRVATTESLAGGAYGYFTVWGKDQLRKPATPSSSADAVTAFLSHQTTLRYTSLDRIRAR
jgi:2',3'-cyclic-nucleotide 2'-phosphodiesterase (5'-nucleotidase family)